MADDFWKDWFAGLGDAIRRRSDAAKPEPFPLHAPISDVEFERMVDDMMDKNAPLYAALARDFYDD